MAPAFQHVAETPLTEQRGGVVAVFAGELAGAASAARHYSPILGAEARVGPGGSLATPLRPGFEHAALLLAGDASLDGQPLAAGRLHYLGVGRHGAEWTSVGGGQVLLIGGQPFGETVLMWWNFVGRTPEEIAQARADWEARERFGEVTAYRGARLRAPELVRFARGEPGS
jgi:redox-sensitive bicupin YhaK (pirin superfamily)